MVLKKSKLGTQNAKNKIFKVSWKGANWVHNDKNRSNFLRE